VALLFVTPQTFVFLAAKDWFFETDACLLWDVCLSPLSLIPCVEANSWGSPMASDRHLAPAANNHHSYP
jgi:hypothetical protein